MFGISPKISYFVGGQAHMSFPTTLSSSALGSDIAFTVEPIVTLH